MFSESLGILCFECVQENIPGKMLFLFQMPDPDLLCTLYESAFVFVYGIDARRLLSGFKFRS